MVLGTVQENETIEHRVLVPPNKEGVIKGLQPGRYNVTEELCTVGEETVTLQQEWPVRRPRPTKKGLAPTKPLITGQRVLDFLFPLPKGGVAAIPGPFGAGKTVTQQQLAKWCDADIIIYIGCGERGNEMTEVLEEFPELEDPKTGNPLMNRTVLVANTSNMPVAAREASVYTGITLAEYYRDQGYDVALMADSTSRWAEAMREISGRLEEMPGEEGYPAYLSKRLAEFYERAGRTETLNGDQASISVVGAVSPPGGDFSEPVTQNTLRIVKAFYALDADLANKRHFPSINWLESYSLYKDNVTEAFQDHTEEDWPDLRQETEELLQKESELQEIVQLVGKEGLPKEDQADLEVARFVREDFLQQNAFHPEDTYCPLKKQYHIIHTILSLRAALKDNVESIDVENVRDTEVSQYISGLKYEESNTFQTLSEHQEKANAHIENAIQQIK
jgi:V/A-type H+-transporting ATPase subunit A